MHILEDSHSAQTRISDVTYVTLQLTESAGNRFRMRGEFGRANTATANGRVYTEQLLMREIRRLRPLIEKRRLFGELDHPSDGGTKLQRVSHVITDLRLEGGIVVGEAEILDTTAGRELKAILAAGCQVGVSSRGYGTTRTEGGKDIVQDDFRLATYDVVADPADRDAWPDIVREGVEHGDPAEDFRAQIEAERQDAVEAATYALEQRFAKALVEHLAALRPAVEAAVQERLMRDPAVGGARRILEELAGVLAPYTTTLHEQGILATAQEAAREAKQSLVNVLADLKRLQAENAELDGLARDLGYQLYLERTLQGDPDASLVVKALGDLKQYASVADFKKRVEEVRQDLAARKEKLAKEQEELEAAQAAAEAEQKRLRKEAREAERENKRLAEENAKLKARVYLDGKIAARPDARALVKMFEEQGITTRKGVDALLESTARRAPARDSNVRDRVRAGLQRGASPTPISEETGRRSSSTGPGSPGYNGTQLDVEEFRSRAGIRD